MKTEIIKVPYVRELSAPSSRYLPCTRKVAVDTIERVNLVAEFCFIYADGVRETVWCERGNSIPVVRKVEILNKSRKLYYLKNAYAEA